jgi:type III secretion system (T3SS) inner membrane Yop/YscD-like protein
MIELLLHRDGAPVERLALTSAITVGGGARDTVTVGSLPETAVTLAPSLRGEVLVHAAREGAHLGGRALRPGTRRLLRPGEELVFAGVRLVLSTGSAAPSEDATRALAGALLADAAAGCAPALGPRLVVLEGAAAGERLALRDGLVLGRGPACDLRLDDGGVSRAHLAFAVRDGRVTVRDLGSKNGLCVNDRRARRSRALAAGDVVEVGETLLALEAGSEPGGARGAAAPPAAPAPRAPAGRPPPPRWLALRASPPLAASALLAAAAALCWAAVR